MKSNKKMSLVIGLLLGGLIMSGCNSEEKEQKLLFEEVMKIHDEVMPDMGKLMKLSKKFKVKANLLLLDSLNATSMDQAGASFDMSEELEMANEGMMNWMRNFELVDESTPHEEAMIYLNKELISVRKVRDDMNKARTKAEELLETE